MSDRQDPVDTNPLTEPEDPAGVRASDLIETEEYHLVAVDRGRMLCVNHGRVCYRRVHFTGEKEWVCPDERHRKPIQNL